MNPWKWFKSKLWDNWSPTTKIMICLGLAAILITFILSYNSDHTNANNFEKVNKNIGELNDKCINKLSEYLSNPTNISSDQKCVSPVHVYPPNGEGYYTLCAKNSGELFLINTNQNKTLNIELSNKTIRYMFFGIEKNKPLCDGFFTGSVIISDLTNESFMGENITFPSGLWTNVAPNSFFQFKCINTSFIEKLEISVEGGPFFTPCKLQQEETDFSFARDTNIPSLLSN